MSNYIRVFAENSYIFITIITNDRQPLLIDNIEVLRKAFVNSKIFYTYEIFGIVILPDHIHMLIKPENIDDYPKIISRIKHHFSKNINFKNTNVSTSKIKKREKGIWQRRYWEHTIRNEKDLYIHLDYIHYNPVKHGYTNATKDWKFCSFTKFVKLGNYELNWGSFNDIQNVVDLDFE